MKKVIPALALVAAVYFGWSQSDRPIGSANAQSHGDQVLAKAFERRERNVQTQGSGVVIKILPDDNDGNRHRRFVLKLGSGQTVLIAHNIDLAARLSSLRVGDAVVFYGEYEWNSRGGVVHWTHRDPDGRHVAGWLFHNGKTYQ